MFTRIFRQYWYPGQLGYRFYQQHYVKKLATYEELNFTEDPIDKRNFVGPYSSTDGYADPVQTILERMKHRQNLELSASATAYVAYNGSKSNISDGFLWREVDFFIVKNLPLMDNRMLYGCLYGVLRSSKGKAQVLESLIKDFNEKALPALDAFGCFELIEAISFGKRQDFDMTNYMHEFIMPKLEKVWRTSRFLHIESYLIRLIVNLASLDYYEKWIWDNILSIIHRKKFKKLETWELFYRTLNTLKDEGIEKDAGINLTPAIQHLEELWGKSVDFQWKYNLSEKRFFTVDELIEKSKDTPEELTWQEGEKYIKHNLPKWYWEMDLKLEKDVSGLYEEYRNALGK